MTSLPSSLQTSLRSTGPKPGSQLIPQDCVDHVMQFTDAKTALSMFLVCRSWYHAVDRFLLLADDALFSFPERFMLEMMRRQRIPPCLTSSLPTLKSDARWDSIDAMIVKVLDTAQPATEII
eukprot:PhF_6_TR42977/c0_g1_i11/m.65464